MKYNSGGKYNIWWGPPRKFSTSIQDRKISWLELFYDLVYVIVISRTTHQLAINPSAQGILDYMLLFLMVFWGWLNGSMYYDLHGTSGIRTRFMTLWQMMAVAALAVTMGAPASFFIYQVTIALIFLQGYIIYLWWSVGIYDKVHRKLNRPYTICFLLALALIVATLYVPMPYKRGLLAMALLFNYVAPFISAFRLQKKNISLNFSASMTERLGLLTIILFGEAILGVINGASDAHMLNEQIWECFGLGILILFALWWFFFSLIADREIESGFLNGQVMALLYIPALASLGVAGATFTELLRNVNDTSGVHLFLRELFGTGLFVFIISTFAISQYLNYPKEYNHARGNLKTMTIISSLTILLITFFLRQLTFINYLLLIFLILFAMIVVIMRMWFRMELKRQEDEVLEN
jgi:low temperature requirement protein LtrA